MSPAMAMATLDAVSEAAVDWLVQWHSGQMSTADHARLADWLAAHPSHHAIWQRLTGTLGAQFGAARGLSTRNAGAALGEALARAEQRGRQRRRLLRGALAVGGIAGTAALVLAERHVPLGQLAADLHTGTGERRDIMLADGSHLTLDARSAVDLDFGPGRRRVRLREGALVAQAMPGDAPFVVQTPHGRIQALGTRFHVRLQAAHTQVGMLEHATRITTANGSTAYLPEGRSARFDAHAITDDGAAPQAAAAWTRGMLEAHDQPLGEVVEALRAYRTGFIRISPQAAAQRVYGSYALDDGDRALAALAETLPISVRVFQRGWLVLIDAS